ncbi:potassium channel family protein [Geoalkalibacter sp.]|uniref:potassium channel family protein n=1 Tax=Geoalkalibacter sp. TaxID=3041440 RepID=UPI00272EC287|nr:TrkA family potassium uptake protein [Geoalkalibacter sp.]
MAKQQGESGDRDLVVIVGCGRLGALLAGRLSQAGRRVVVIDRREEAFNLLPAEFSGFRVTGDAVEHEVLRAADLAKAGCLIAVTQKDTLNLMVAQVARLVFAVPRVLARVYDPRKEVFYQRFGIETVSPTELTADALVEAVGLG